MNEGRDEKLQLPLRSEATIVPEIATAVKLTCDGDAAALGGLSVTIRA